MFVQPNQRGTAEEIEDYIREFDCLHSLTVLTPSRLGTNVEVFRCWRDNWTSSLQAFGRAGVGGWVGEGCLGVSVRVSLGVLVFCTLCCPNGIR